MKFFILLGIVLLYFGTRSSFYEDLHRPVHYPNVKLSKNEITGGKIFYWVVIVWFLVVLFWGDLD